jgi:hypothetical protein
MAKTGRMSILIPGRAFLFCRDASEGALWWFRAGYVSRLLTVIYDTLINLWGCGGAGVLLRVTIDPLIKLRGCGGAGVCFFSSSSKLSMGCNYPPVLVW